MSDFIPVNDTRATLGEGSIWHKGKLYWIDIHEKRVFIYEPKSNSQRTIQLDQLIGTVLPKKSGGLLIALQNGIYTLNEDNEKIDFIIDPEKDMKNNRFNDGKCDPAGRFWAGTMDLQATAGKGSLYMLDINGSIHEKLAPVSISNGICWSLDSTIMYYIDTPTRKVLAFDFDLETGNIKQPRTVISIPEKEGSPDGMTIDSEGNLWIALWDGGAVACYNPQTGKRLHKVELPAARITSCAFGGDHLETLYITSAKIKLTKEELEQQPFAGGLFAANVGVKGVPAFAYNG